MNNKVLRLVVITLGAMFAFHANAATDWSTQDYDLYPGDFDGDGKTDILYIAKDPAKLSGIARSDGNGPNILWQTWPSNYLGIQWYGGVYTAVIGNFNNDNRADILLQRTTPGDSFLLLSDASGRITGISQTIASNHLGLTWSLDQHKIIAGDFSGDGKSDLFFQSTSSLGIHAVLSPDNNGLFVSSPSPQTWTDAAWNVFEWSTKNSVISVGDFNGDGKTDLLVQSKPDIILIDYEIPIPVPVYKPNTFGVVRSQGGSTPFAQSGVQQWNRNSYGVDWSPVFYNVVVGNFLGNQNSITHLPISDVLLQAKNAGKPNYLVRGNESGQPVSLSTSVSSNVAITADSARLVAGTFGGPVAARLYVQSTSSSGTNYTTTSVGSSISASSHNLTTVTGIQTATAVGATAGSFDVDRLGAANYRIPIVVPPGIKGVQPNLALTYSSNAGNGLLGMGWSLSGMSQIALCAATLDQDGYSAPALPSSESSRLCLDGSKLHQTNAASYGTNPYFQAGATYETEQKSFARIVNSGTAASVTAYFTVHRKDGLKYQYGGTDDSRIQPLDVAAPYAWLLNRVRDRAGNTMTFEYEKDGAPNGSYRPKKIFYTTNTPAGINNPAYEVRFIWEARPESDSYVQYTKGSRIRETKRLRLIETYYNSTLVRKYELAYQQGSTQRSRLVAVQECAGSGECLAPTMFTWQDHSNSWSTEQTVTASGLDSVAAANLHAIDITGDGRTDLVSPRLYSQGWGSPAQRNWTIEKSDGASFTTEDSHILPAGSEAQIALAMPVPVGPTGGVAGLLLEHPGLANNVVGQPPNYRGTMTANSHNAVSTDPVTQAFWAGDVDADGDIEIATVDESSIQIHSVVGSTLPVSGSISPVPMPGGLFLEGHADFQNPDKSVQRGGPRKLPDFNGDGKTDFVAQKYVVYRYDLGTGFFEDPTQHWYENLAWSVHIALVSSPSGYQLVTLNSAICGNEYIGGAPCASGPKPIYVGDFNGDSLTDVLNVDGVTGQWQIYWGTGGGLSASQVVSLPPVSIPFVADLTSDGSDDLVYSVVEGGTTVWKTASWTGTAFVSATTSALPADATFPQIIDVDADGLPDVGYFRDGSYRYRLHAGPKSDLLTSATDGFGNQIAVTYVAALDSSVYSTGAAPIEPNINIPAAQELQAAPPGRVVVKDHRATDGSGGEYTIKQRYTGARTISNSRGFLGFEKREEEDSRTNMVRHTDYVHLINNDPSLLGTMSYPLTGRPVKTWATQLDGTMVRETSYKYTMRQEGEGEPGGITYTCGEGWVCSTGFGSGLGATVRIHMFAEEVVQKAHEVGGTRDGVSMNGTLLSESKTVINVMDDYGNSTDVTTTVEDKDNLLPASQRTFTTRVVNTITNETTPWCIGRANRTETTTTLGDGTSRKQTQSRAIDYQKCRVTDELTEPDAGGQPTALSVQTHYDFGTGACGNPSTVTVTGYRLNGTTVNALMPRTTSFEYGAECVAVRKIKDPYLAETNRTYDYRFGALQTETTPHAGIAANHTTTWAYDAFGRRISEARADGTSTTVAFTACNFVNSYCGVSDLRMRIDTTQRDKSGAAINTSNAYFDAVGRLRVQSTPLPLSGELSYVVSTYDALGRLATRTVPYTIGVPARTVYEYDLIGRRKITKLLDGQGAEIRRTSVAYAGRATIFKDPLEKETEKVFDILGQVRKVKEPTSTLYTTYDYTFSGGELISSVTDKLGNPPLTTKSNVLGHKTRTEDPDMGTWTFKYTSLGELIEQTDAKGQTTSFDPYDLLGRPTVRHEAEGATHDTYFVYTSPSDHAYGQLKSISSNGYAETYTYDVRGRPYTTQIAIPGDTTYSVDYRYDDSAAGTGLLDTVTYPASTGTHPLKVKYGYTKGVQTTVRDFTNDTLGTTYWQLTAMDALGNVTGEQLGNNMKVLTGYDPTTGLMSSRQAGTDYGAANRQNLSYEWYSTGNLKRRTDLNQLGLNEEFFYDDLNRLDRSNRNGVQNLDLVYTEIGNIDQKLTTDSATNVGSYNYTTPQTGCSYYAHAQPHAVRKAGTSIFCYDANGNMTSRPGATLTWYSDNSVKKITQGSVSSEFWYSPSGDRFKQHAIYAAGNETTYYVSGLMEKVVTATGTGYRHYIAAGSNSVVHTRWSTGVTKTYYATTDHLGSSSSITDESGAVIVTESFDAFGKRRGTTWSGTPTSTELQAIGNATRLGYTGHEHLDNLGLIHMNGRVQDPVLGRFLSADPIVQAPEFSQSLNRYSYVWNNPLSMTDPGGFEGEITCIDGSKVIRPDDCEKVTVTGRRGFSEDENLPCPSGGEDCMRGNDARDWWRENVNRAPDRPDYPGNDRPLNPNGGPAYGLGEWAYDQCATRSCHGNNTQPYEIYAHPISEKAGWELGITAMTLVSPRTLLVNTPKALQAWFAARATQVHANSFRTTKMAEGYTLRDRFSGEVMKYGETTRGPVRYSQKYLDDNNFLMQFEVKGSKKEMHQWQHEMILDYKNATGGHRPPYNKSDY